MQRFRRLAMVSGLSGALVFGAIGVVATGASAESTSTMPSKKTPLEKACKKLKKYTDDRDRLTDKAIGKILKAADVIVEKGDEDASELVDDTLKTDLLDYQDAERRSEKADILLDIQDDLLDILDWCDDASTSSSGGSSGSKSSGGSSGSGSHNTTTTSSHNTTTTTSHNTTTTHKSSTTTTTHS